MSALISSSSTASEKGGAEGKGGHQDKGILDRWLLQHQT